MAEFIIPVGAVAAGNHVGNPPNTGIQVTDLPLVDFVLAQGGDPSVAKILITVDDADLHDENVDGDAEMEQVLYDNTLLEAVVIDIDNDGEPDYRLVAQNQNDRFLHTGNQEGDNVARLNGLAHVIEISSGQEVATLGGGDLFLSSNGDFPAVGEVKDIINAGSLRFTVVDSDPETFPCFAAGTRILTPSGECPVNRLRAGDRVITRDHGVQEIRWIGSTKLNLPALHAAPNLRPIRIRAGALGENTPSTDLLVSPQHRVLVRSKIAQRMFGTMEVLVAAKHLLKHEGIDIAEEISEVEYFHFLFDQHEVVYSNGAETESLYTGSQALKSVGAAAREEIFALFPELENTDHTPIAARTLPSGRQARKLAMRHLQNGKPLAS